VERLLIWRGLDEWRAETSHVRIDDDRLTATGTQLGVSPEPYRLDYALRTGPRFVTETLDLSVLRDGALKRARVVRDHDGGWTVDDRPLPDLDGAIDTDLMASPLFNTMPVLRDEMLGGGEPRDLVMAFVSVPDLAVTRSDQRYTPLGDGRVNYRSGDFTADIEYDADGLVLNYPGLAERVET
jgi:uncharacterized protein